MFIFSGEDQSAAESGSGPVRLIALSTHGMPLKDCFGHPRRVEGANVDAAGLTTGTRVSRGAGRTDSVRSHGTSRRVTSDPPPVAQDDRTGESDQYDQPHPYSERGSDRQATGESDQQRQRGAADDREGGDFQSSNPTTGEPPLTFLPPSHFTEMALTTCCMHPDARRFQRASNGPLR